MVTSNRLKRLQNVAAARQPGTVVLENVHDPHNCEAVIRTCDSLGIHHIHLISEATSSFDPRLVGRASSSSANKWLSFTHHKTTKSCLAQLKSEGYTLFATVIDQGAESIYQAKLDVERPALMFGNEHSGLSQTAIKQADMLITVPMQGIIQSLNISVTAAICLFELTRQRIASGSPNTKVCEAERQEILSQLLMRHYQRS